MGGFGASYVNQVLGTLLIAHAIYYRRHLTRTKIQSIIYPVACCFAGYALFSYTIDWFVSGYIFHSSLESANLHLTAFALAIVLVLVSFILRDVNARSKVLYYFKKLYELVTHR